MRNWAAAVLACGVILSGVPALAASDEQAFFETLRLLQLESANIDQAYVLDVSGSMQETLPISRKMMTEFIHDLARDGDRLLVVAVGKGDRVLIDEVVSASNRQRLFQRVSDPRLASLGEDFASGTDLDAGVFEVLKHFDALNEARMRADQVPHRQLVHTFSDFKKEPAADSPFAHGDSGPAQSLAGLRQRLKVLTVKSADAIEEEFTIDFKGVPFRIEQAEFLLPGAQGKGAPHGAFDAYLRHMIADEFETRARTPEKANRFAKRLERLHAEVARRLAIANPTDFSVAPGGHGVVGVVKVKNGFKQTALKELGLEVVAQPDDAKAEAPDAVTDLAPGEEAAFEVTFPELAPPPWYSLQPAVYRGQHLTLRPVGQAAVGEKNPDTHDLAMLTAPQALSFDIEIPANPMPLFGLGALVLAGLGALAFFVARAQLGPRELALRVKMHDPSGEVTAKELKLANGGYQIFGGKERGNVPIAGFEEPLVKIVRQGAALTAEGLGARFTVSVDAQALKSGQRVPLKEKGRILVKPDTVGPHLVEIVYEVGAGKPGAQDPQGRKPGAKPTADGTLPSTGGRRKF